MYSVQLNETEKANLIMFLGRADLKGIEAPTLVNLAVKIGQAPKISLKEGGKTE